MLAGKGSSMLERGAHKGDPEILKYTYYKDRPEWPKFSPLKKEFVDRFRKEDRDVYGNFCKAHHFSYGKSRKLQFR